MPNLRCENLPSTEVGAEGVKLACITPEDGETVLQKTFEKYVFTFYKSKTFVSTTTLFVDRRCGPTWFREPFPSPNAEKEKNICGVLMECFRPAPLWTRLAIEGSGIRLVTYYPKMVARQFGSSQLLPKYIIPSED